MAFPNRTLKPNPFIPDPSFIRQYQISAIKRLCGTKRMILGDDVGLGKTLEALAAFSYMKTQLPELKMLVFTEVAAIGQWEEEVEKFTKGLTVEKVTARTPKKERDDIFRRLKADITVTSYSLVHRNYMAMLYGMQRIAPMLVADEPTAFKNTKSKLHEKMLTLAGYCPRVYGLTATPVENSLVEMWGMFRVIVPGLFPTKKFFMDRWCVVQQNHWTGFNEITGYKNLRDYREHISPHYFGRLQTDPSVDQELPDVIYKDVRFDLPPKTAEAYEDAENRMDPNGEPITVLPALSIQQDLCNDPTLQGIDEPSPKIEALRDMLLGSLANEKVAVFTKRRVLVDTIELLLRKDGHKVVRITGAESPAERTVARQTFQNHDGPVVMLLTKAGGRALNLQAGGHLIFFDLPWSYGQTRQVIGRLKRVGSSHRRIAVYFFLARASGRPTIDQHVLSVVKKKKVLFNAVLGDDDDIKTTKSDLAEIIAEIQRSKK